jgi:hypothetical protein
MNIVDCSVFHWKSVSKLPICLSSELTGTIVHVKDEVASSDRNEPARKLGADANGNDIALLFDL